MVCVSPLLSLVRNVFCEEMPDSLRRYKNPGSLCDTWERTDEDGHGGRAILGSLCAVARSLSG